MAWKRVWRLIKPPLPLKEVFLSKCDATWDTRDINYHETNYNIDGTSKYLGGSYVHGWWYEGWPWSYFIWFMFCEISIVRHYDKVEGPRLPSRWEHLSCFQLFDIGILALCLKPNKKRRMYHKKYIIWSKLHWSIKRCLHGPLPRDHITIWARGQSRTYALQCPPQDLAWLTPRKTLINQGCNLHTTPKNTHVWPRAVKLI